MATNFYLTTLRGLKIPRWMCRAEILIGELPQPLRMAVLHNSASTEVRCRLKSPISSETAANESAHFSNKIWWEHHSVLFSQLVSLFVDALCLCGFESISFDILLLSHKMTRHRPCKKVNGETHITFECECQCCLEPCMYSCLCSMPALGVSWFATRTGERDAFQRDCCLNCRACLQGLGCQWRRGTCVIQAQVSGFVFCRLVSWVQMHSVWDRQGGCEGCVKASSLNPCHTEPGSLLQPALEGDNHERG